MTITRQKIRIVLLGLILVLSLGVGIAVFTHQRLETEEDIIEDITVEADATLNQFTYTQIEDGRTKWELEAQRGIYDAERNVADLDDIHAEFFANSADENITMTADAAQAYLDKGIIEARGNVVITTANGYRLRTPALEYSKHAQHDISGHGEGEDLQGFIYTSEVVDFEAEAVRIQGTGMTYEIGPRFLRIHTDVTAHFYPRFSSDAESR
jgi:LPS export ABC transporter protein LptC